MNINELWFFSNRLRGEDLHPRSKLTSEQVLQIRDLYKQGFSTNVIARNFKVSKWNVEEIVKKNLDTPIETNKIYNEDCLLTLSKMKDESVDLIVTSPPYNKNHWIKNKSSSKDSFIRKIEYSSYDDNLPQEEYVEYIGRRKLLVNV